MHSGIVWPELYKWSNGEEIKTKRTERWLSLPAGHAGGEDDASDSVLPSFSLDRGEAEMDAGNKRGGQRAKKRQWEPVASERMRNGGCRKIRRKKSLCCFSLSSSVRILYPCEPEGCGFT